MKKSNAACLLAFFVFINSLFSPSQFAQNQRPEAEQVLKLKAELINLRAVVTDKNGKIIDGLKREDFAVLENNRPQEISFFSIERISSPTPLAGEITPADSAQGQAANQALPSNASRTIALFVDTVNLSLSNIPLVKAELKKFLATQLREHDWVAILTTNNGLGILEQFTQDRQLLHRAIDKLRPWQPVTGTQFFTPYLAAQALNANKVARLLALCMVKQENGEVCTLQDANPLTLSISPADENRINARAREVLLQANQRRQITLSTLKAVSEGLQDLPGQKILALFSDGFTLFDSSGHADLTSLQAVTSRALRSGVVIYSFDTKGLKLDDAFADASVGTFLPPPQFAAYAASGNRDFENSLNALAADTGGKALFNTNNLNLGLQKALDENSVYYGLDYYSSNESTDDKFRKISVSVKNRPDLKVRAQRGYLPVEIKVAAPPLTVQQRLVKAMTAPLPTTTLGVRATAEYLEIEGDSSQVTLSVYTDPNRLDYAEQNNLRAFNLEVGIAVLDESGRLVKTFNEQIRGSLSPEQVNLAKRNSFKYSKRIALKPGVYNLRIGVLETATEKIGTTTNWVEVPDLSKGKLAVSDLLLINSVSQDAQKSTLSQPISKQGSRVYKSVDVLSYAFKIYNSTDEASLTMQLEFTQNGQPILQTDWLKVTAMMDDKDRKGINVSQQFKLNKLKPGTYELKLKVKDARNNQTAEAEALFSVEG